MFKKKMNLVIASALVVSMLFTGCGAAKNEADSKATSDKKVTSSESKEVKKDKKVETKVLKVFLGGDRKEGSDDVFAKANEMLEEKLPGVQLDIQVLPYGEWQEKWKLLTAAGDQMDVAWIGWMLNYDLISREGQLTPLEDLIEKNAPKMKDMIPEFVFEKATVDGHVYSVPNYQQMTEMRRGIRLYKDIADKCVDVEALEAKFTSDLTFDADDWAELEKYFAYAKENGLLQKGPSITLAWLAKNGYESIGNQDSPAAIRIGDKTCEVINPYKTEQYKTMIDTMADWYKKGYIREDILSVEKPRADEFVKGGNISWVHETHKGQSEKDTVRAAVGGNPVELVVVPTADFQYIAPYGTPTNLAIPFTAKYPEEAIQVINLLNTDKEFYNLMVYGQEGVNYEKIDDNNIKVIDPDLYGLAGWATGNTMLAYQKEGAVEGWNEYLDDMHRKADKSYLMGFKANSEPYSTQLQQIATVVKEYQFTLEYGAVGDGVQVKYDEFLEKLDRAGINEVIEGFQAQIDEFLGNK